MADNFDDAAASVTHEDMQNTALQVRNTMQFALPANPDTEAQHNALARQTGTPIDTVRAMPDVVKTQAQLQGFDAQTLAQKFPNTAKYLTDLPQARAAHDDVPALTQTEAAVKAISPPPQSASWADYAMAPLKGLGGSFNRAGMVANLILGGVPVLADKVTGGTSASDWWFSHMVQPLQDRQQAFNTTPNANIAEKALNQTGNLLGMFSQIALTGGMNPETAVPAAVPAEVSAPNIIANSVEHATKSMAFPAVTDAVNTGNDVYAQTGDAGAAVKAATAQWAATTGMGVMPLSMEGKLLARLFTGGASGMAVGELNRQVMNAALPESMQQKFSIDDLLLQGLTGAALGGVMGPRSAPEYRLAQDELRKTYSGLRDADAIDAVSQAVSGSNLRERDPVAFRQFVDGMAKDTPNLFVNVDDLAGALHQSGVSAAEVAAKMPGVADQFHEAVETGGLVKIPLADYATYIAGGKLDEALKPHLKTDPDAFSRGEIDTRMQAQNEDFQKEVARVMDEKASDQTWQASREAVKQQVLDNLNQINRFPPEVNARNAELISNYAAVRGEQTGKTPEQFFKDHMLGVNAEALDGQNLSQDVYNAAQGDENGQHGRPARSGVSADQGLHATVSGEPAAEGWAGATRASRDGKPVTFYRGAQDPLQAQHFDREALGKASGNPSSGLGVWFTPHSSEAARYGSVEKFNLDVRNPKVIKVEDLPAFDSVADAHAYREKLRSEGYDGIVVTAKHLGGPVHMVAFDPHQAIRPEQKLYQPDGGTSQHGSVALRALANEGNNEAIVAQALIDRAGISPEEFADVLKGVSVGAQSDGVTGVPALSSVLSHMRSAVLDDPKILDAVVRSVPVDMVNNLFGSESAAKMALHDEAMLKDSSAFNADLPVATAVDTASPVALLVREAARRTAEIVRVAFGSGGKSAEGISAIRAGKDSQVVSPKAAYSPLHNTITLLHGADLSSFLHESGHYFFDTDIKVAGQLASEAAKFGFDTLKPGEQRIVNDVSALLKWHGIQGGIEEQLRQWHNMDFEEQRAYHERTAESFERYLLEGKAPSIELQPLFRTLRQWMLSVYQGLKNFLAGHPEAGTLSDEVRGVFDRMLASEDAIKEAEATRSFFAFTKPEDADAADYERYVDLGKQATEDAIDQLQAKSVKDMQWLENAKSKALKDLQRQASGLRSEQQIEARREVMTQPVYRAWDFLTGKMTAEDKLQERPKSHPDIVDPKQDSLFTAIAKLGGIRKDDAVKEWGIDPKEKPESGVFGKPVWRRDGGKTLDDMANELSHHGYVPDGYDLNDLHDRFTEELAGRPQYSHAYEPDNLAPGEQVRNPEALKAQRLDEGALRAMGVDPAQIELLKARKMVGKNGLHPDLVAEMFGLNSGEDLIRQITAAPKPAEAIDAVTDQLMLAKHGDLATPDAIEQAAVDAIHNRARGRFMATGLKILAKSPVPAEDLLRGAKDAAETAVAAKKVGELNPRQYAIQEGKANKEVTKLAPTDPNGAVKAQRAALLNNQLVRATTDAMRDVRDGLDYFKKVQKSLGKLDPMFRTQVSDLLAGYDLRTSLSPEAAQEKSAMKLSAFVEKLAANQYSLAIPEWLLNEANRTHYKDMTVEQFRGLVDSIKMLDHLGREVKKVSDGGTKRDLDEVAAEAKAAAAMLPPRKNETNRGLNSVEQKWLGAKQGGRSFIASLLKMEQMTDWLDRYNSNGIFNRMMFRKMADAEGVRNDLDKKITQQVQAYVKAIPPDILKNARKSVEMPGVVDKLTGQNQRLTWGQKMGLAGIRGDAQAFDKLVRGEGWDPKAVNAFLDANMTKEEWGFIKGLSDQFQEVYEVKKKMLESIGATLPRDVDRIPFQTRHGEMPGWYWPIKYDPSRDYQAREHQARGIESIFEDNFFSKPDTSTGREMTRNDHYAKPMLLSLDTVPRILKDEIRDATTRAALLDVQKFLRHPDVIEAISTALSPQHYEEMGKWLVSLANDAHVDPRELQVWDRLAHEIRTRTTMVGLGFRLTTMAMHGLTAGGESIAEAGPKAMFKGITDKRTLAALSHIGPEWMQKGLDSFIRSEQWDANKDFIFQRSAEMRHRSAEIERDVRDKLREIDIKLMNPALGAIERGRLAIQSRAYSGIAMLDMASALPTWMGGYLKALEKHERGGLGMSEQDAVYFADKTLRNAHGGGGIKDLAGVQRGSEWFKLFTMFYTFWNHNINRIIDTQKRVRELPATYRDAKESGDWAGFRGDVGMLVLRTFMYTLGVQAVHHMMHPPKKDEGEVGWLKWFGEQMAMSASGGIPLLRDVVAHYAGGKDYELSPVASVISSTDLLAKDVEGTSHTDKFIKHAMTTAGYVTGLPTGQAASSVQFLSDVWNGKQRPQDVTDWWNGIMHGDMHKH